MQTSREALLKDARKQGYKPENLDKVYHLLDTFQQLMTVPFLKDRLVLKGGVRFFGARSVLACREYNSSDCNVQSGT